MDNARANEGGTTPGFGQSVIRVGTDSKVRVWGGCDSERAWLLRDRLDHLAATGQRSITLDVAELRFDDFTAVAILVGALARIRQHGAEVAVSPPTSGAYQVLKRAEIMTTRARLQNGQAMQVSDAALHDRGSFRNGRAAPDPGGETPF